MAQVHVAVDLLDAHLHGTVLRARADQARVVELAADGVGEVELIVEHGLAIVLGGLHVDVELGVLHLVDHDPLLARGWRGLRRGGARPQPRVE